MDDLINSGAEAVSDPDGALMVVSAINSIIGGKDDVLCICLHLLFVITFHIVLICHSQIPKFKKTLS